MIRLHSRGNADSLDAPIVGIVRWQDQGRALGVYTSRLEASVSNCTPNAVVRATDAIIPPEWELQRLPTITISGDIQPLDDGDIVGLQSSGYVRTLFRAASANNSLFVTEQCNSYCLMCSQPPRRVNDLEQLLAI